MSAIHISKPIVQMLQERGFLPANCVEVRMMVPPNGAMVITFDVYVTDEHLQVLADVFAAQAAEVRARAERESDFRP